MLVVLVLAVVNAMDAVNNLLNLKFDDFDLKLKAYASENNVPIIFDEGLAFLETIIRLYKPKNILEIGTAIGYSAIRMHKVCGSNITTIERNPKMYEEALKNINDSGNSNYIKVVFKDALEAFDDVSNQTFDMIFIDAAKAQYQKFFEKYVPFLKDDGIVITDNILFHGCVEQVVFEENNDLSKNVKNMAKKLDIYNNYLSTLDEYKTYYLNIGDGLAVTVRK